MNASSHPHEQLRRHQKALELADVLSETGVSSRMAIALPDDTWLLVAGVARVSQPSSETKTLVVEMIRAREAVRSIVASQKLAGRSL